MVIDITKPPYGFPEKYQHINPKKRIPILEYDDEIITETTAIMTAMSRLAPETHLFGKTDLEVARTYEWLNWLSGTVHERGLGALFSPQWYSDDVTAHEGISKKARAWVDHCFGLIEDRLANVKTSHASGDTFTVADVFLWVMYRWGYLLKIDMEKHYPSWTKVVAIVVQRQAVKAAVEKEGIPIIRDDRPPPEEGKMHDRGF
ncbi:hypothetical protein DOTSEDRAFT_70409 [Dothistroma septosporum NZE10]|uniref:GST C-terminal domain-containing protein n=1 Tax=Dothistroma septosporum (strain NZE10 / CBS 128990) TaxID=675120 RepID=N1PSH0_DOTSN|nr:hypothetical protein DOTSEDRAFT_70409 [Dothistroma septosporum NZE10]